MEAMGTNDTGRFRLRLIGIVGGAVALMVILLVLPRGEVPLPPPEHKVEVIARNLVVPWSIDMDDDGTIYFTERVGRLNTINRDGRISTIYSREVASVGEGGMLGLALDPEFKHNGYIYLYYTYSTESGLFNRVVRLESANDGNYREHILLDGIPGGEVHNGGRIKFGPDGMLYIATGDAGREDLAQDINSLAGKILRINKDGSIPEDNPFGNAVYSYGHRNVQGLAWHPTSKNLYATEHGPVANDEINLIIKGANYGWPIEICSKAERYERSILCYSVGIAPAGAAFADYGGNTSLFYATLRGQHVERISFDEDENIARIENFLTGLGRVRDVYAGKDGYLYIATSNRDGRGVPVADDDRIVRVRLTN